MGYNKFITKGGAVILDLSNITVTAEKLGQGSTAVDKTGTLITGVMEGPKNALIDVEALPTENIDPVMVYRTVETFNEPPVLYFYFPDYGIPLMPFGQMLALELPEGVELTESYIEVDELPANEEIELVAIDMEAGIAAIPVYILRSTGVGYVAMDREGTIVVMSAGAGMLGDSSFDKGYVDSADAIAEPGAYAVRGANYSVYHLWVYNEDKWFELLETIEVSELPVENIDSGVCYVVVAADGKRQYFIYSNNVWVEYSSGGGEEFINYISGVDAETFELPKDIESIAPYACYGRGYKTVIIPNTVKTIGDNAFGNCAALTDVYFVGSEDEWNTIAIGAGNDSLTNATKTYNYEKNS